MYTQYRAKENQIDHVFPKRKLGVEIDENGHVDRDPDCKKKRQELIEDHGFTIIRTNPDVPDFNIYRLINQIRMHMDQVTIKSTRSLLIDDFSRELLEAVIGLKSKYKEVKAKLIKNIVKNVLPEYKK